MKKNYKPKKSLRSRKGTRAKRKRAELNLDTSPYWASYEIRNPEAEQAKRHRKIQERIFHDEKVHNRKYRQKMVKERHKSITAKLKEWMKGLVKKER